MKSILISIKPEWVAKILNGDKTIEIRKTMPKCELPIKCYIYCTKDKEKHLVNVIQYGGNFGYYCVHKNSLWRYKDIAYEGSKYLNGKVVAEFTLNRVEEFDYFYSPAMGISGYRNQNNEMLPYDKCCLKKEEIVKYADDGQLLPKPVFAWYIDNLKIYDKPKELEEFYKQGTYSYSDWLYGYYNGHRGARCNYNSYLNVCRIKKPPQSWCYVEEV